MAFDNAGRFGPQAIIDQAGNTIAGATVEVFDADGTTPSTLWTDRTKGTEADNPVSVDANGNVEFFTEPGIHVIKVTVAGIVRLTDEITVAIDPEEADTVATDHGALQGLADDDHPQYFDETRHDAHDHTGLTGVPTDHGGLDGLADDDHTQYLNAARHATENHTGATGVPSSHGELTDLLEDDHTQYSRVDGTRAFTDEVEGVTPTTDPALATKGYVDGEVEAIPVVIGVACSDELTPIDATGVKTTFRMPYALMLTEVRASLTGACTTGTFTVDIHEGGTTILSTKITIDATEKTSESAATPPVISEGALADDAEITIEVDNVGDGTATGLKVWLRGTPA